MEAVMERDDIKGDVRGFIESNFLFGGSASLGDADSLIEGGVIDSTGVIEVISFLEEKFGVAIDDSDLVADNFDSIEKIAKFVAARR
jgi:acyl carrier protein